MGKIKILPPHEAQKIAAGEVIDRPANVVKELIENSLDAGASSLILKLNNGGKTALILIDNGCGMSAEDARLAIHNHATSKLHNVDDIPHLSTFGFRGEALASIAAVSQMSITTKTADDLQGVQLTIDAGTILHETYIACNTGTTIEINNIFYNLPARKKFLKKDETEWNVIYQMIQALCLAHRHCSFTIYHNDHQVLHAPAVATLQERVTQIFDSTLATNTIACTAENKTHGISITAVVTHPTYHRYDRNYLFFFVNNRWVKNHKLGQAVIKAYASILPARRYPAGAFFITIDPELVDINIHPRKEEVQFLHPRVVEDALELMVHTALQNSTARDLGATFTPAPKTVFASAPQKISSTHAAAPSSPPQPWQFGRIHNIPQPHVITASQKPVPAPALEEQEKINTATSLPIEHNYRLIGQLHATYIIIETDEGMVLIDQHAAHERILYEQFGKRFENSATTHLMFPQLITLSAADAAIVKPWLSIFAEHGIILEQLNGHQLVVKAVPVHAKQNNIEELVKAAIGWIHETETIDVQQFAKSLHDKMRCMMACKAAIKAGDILDERQMHELLEKLHATENRMTCPHGRPTTLKISISEIERKFKRVE